MSSDQTAVIRGCINHKLLSPGLGKLYVSYYRQKVFADILENGTMRFDGKVYVNASALTLAMKRTLNPAIKSDPGWMSLFVADTNKCLKDIREQWIEKITPPPPTSSSSTPSHFSSSTLMKSQAAIRPKQLLPSSTGHREICHTCKRDRGPLHVTCEACRRSYHNACISSTSLTPSTTPWYCEGCIEQHCAIVLKFLRDLRHVAKYYDVQLPSTAVEGTQPTAPDAVASTADGPAPATPEAAAAPSSSPSLLAQVDTLINQLETPATRLNVLANSTGELLVHLSHLDVAAGLRTLDDQLETIAAACSRDNEPDDVSQILSPGAEGILKVLNLRHGIMSARYHAKRTTAALTTLSEKRIRASVKAQAKVDEAFEKEDKVRLEWETRVREAATDVRHQHTHITHINALVDNAVRHRKTLRATSLKNRFIPAYRMATKDLTLSSDHLLITIVADKLKGVAASLNEWEAIQHHFDAMHALLVAQKTTGQPTTTTSSSSSITSHAAKTPVDPAERPLKLAKLELELPRPPSLKLVDRQLKEVAANLAVVQTHKTKALETLSVIQQSFQNRIGAPASNEWQALMATMAEMVRKCQPTPDAAPSTSSSSSTPATTTDAVETRRATASPTHSTVEGQSAVEDEATAAPTSQTSDVEGNDDHEAAMGKDGTDDGPEVVSLDGDDDDDDVVEVLDDDDDEEDDVDDADYVEGEHLDDQDRTSGG
ncbi:hypothetical protein, variant [Aphanomyces astaci]|uniref:PHD-type domain-containing protein n=1 Tax=Aphanomyces astaci TaxID=112090 RepID=W4H1S6_APHAT|nr:hypothetical protein, variant [Aphanomyces astaci]ETV85093.1 hypothetical protein, variant [Aphanomyces astaci]|eukprot:XP_009825111.1 hypothetical protein, variant [Aphanomyces astaci]